MVHKRLEREAVRGWACVFDSLPDCGVPIFCVSLMGN